jgi:hypothetical protein
MKGQRLVQLKPTPRAQGAIQRHTREDYLGAVVDAEEEQPEGEKQHEGKDPPARTAPRALTLAHGRDSRCAC